MPTKRMCAAAANTPTHLVVVGVKRYSRYPIHVVMKMWRPACIESVHVHQTRMEYMWPAICYIPVHWDIECVFRPYTSSMIIDGKTVDQTSLSDTMQIIIGKQHHTYGMCCNFCFCSSILTSVFQLPLHTEKCNPCLHGSLPRLL